MGAMDRNRNRQIDKDEFYQYYKSWFEIFTI